MFTMKLDTALFLAISVPPGLVSEVRPWLAVVGSALNRGHVERAERSGDAFPHRIVRASRHAVPRRRVCETAV